MTDSLERLTAALADRYRLERELGAGGMATVYLATDLKHHRQVAIKVLRPELAAILGVERFLQEIELTAQLQHPHILPLFDSGQVDHQLFYVMPYVAGESLADRLARERQLPVEEAIRLTAEAADALDYAHRHGVVHRDIKPANILLQEGRVLVADFGIARAVRAAGADRMTGTGLSLGTPGYMSPEQAAGDREVDGRSDQFSLGCVAYQMLVGEPPHTGPTIQAIIARVLADRPGSIRAVRPTVPAHVETAIFTALEKLPADRFNSAADLAAALVRPGPAAAEATVTSPAPIRRGRMVSAAIAAALLLGTGLGLGLGWRWRGRAGEQGQSPLRLTIAPPPSHDFSVFPAAVSPDGRTVAFAASKGDTTRLFLRRLDRFDAVAIPGSETGSTPTFSANGRWIFFGVNAEIRRAPVAGGPAVTIGTAPNFINTLQWLGPDTLVVVGAGGGLVLFPAGGGKATVLTALDTLRGEITHRSPLVLPGGGLAFAVALEDGSQGRIAITGPERRGWKYLPPGVEGDPKAYLDPGYILFEPRGGGLQAVPVASAGTPSSEPVRVAEGGFLYAVSAAGTAVSFSGVSTTRPVWVDSLGRITPTAIEPAPRYRWPRIAPNGRSLAMGEVPRGGFGDIVVAELGSGRKVRLASPGQQGGEAVWRPDGLLLTGWGRGGSALFELFSHSPDGASPPARFLAGPMDLNATSWSADGRFLLVAATGPETDGRYDVYVREPDGRLRRFVGGPGDQRAGQFSPDGRWVAYSSGEGGRTEILVTDWPAASRRWTVSSGGGSDPVWARDGRELFYRSGDRMMAVAVASTGPFSAGEPRELFRGPFLIDPFGDQSYDVAADGRFLMIERTPGVQVDLQVTVNWLPELRRLLR